MRDPGPTAVMAALLLVGGSGCKKSVPAAPTAGVAATPAGAPERGDADDPLVKEARPATEAVLDDLLAGRSHGDSGLARLAEKVAGYRSWTIEGQRVEPDLPEAVHFDGTLKGPSGEAAYTVLMVKQRNGRWMIGTFSGPDPK